MLQHCCHKKRRSWIERLFYGGAPSGARFSRVKVPNPLGSGKDIVEGKGVHREVEPERSRMWEQTNHGQTSGLMNRNRI